MPEILLEALRIKRGRRSCCGERIFCRVSLIALEVSDDTEIFELFVKVSGDKN